MQRIEVVSDHSAIALANVADHNELFLMPVWRAIGKSKWVLEARQLPWTVAASVTLVVVLLILCLWPADFELSGKGILVPAVRRQIFAKGEGEVIAVPVKHGQMVKKGDVLAEMRNLELNVKISTVQGQLNASQSSLANYTSRLTDPKLDPADQSRLNGEKLKAIAEVKSYREQLELLKDKVKQLTITSPVDGQVVTWDVHNILIFRPISRGRS